MNKPLCQVWISFTDLSLIHLRLTTSKNLYAFVCLKLNLPGGATVVIKDGFLKYRPLVRVLYEWEVSGTGIKWTFGPRVNLYFGQLCGLRGREIANFIYSVI